MNEIHFFITAIVFTLLGLYWGRHMSIYLDVREVTKNVISQLEEKGFLAMIINERGEEELVPHPLSEVNND